MAENSLFAILLRSPWWASLGIAVALALLMRLLLPKDYAVAGMLGSFPFVVIAAIAAWKQLRAPSATQLAQTLERLQAMNSREFADAIEAAFRAQGHEVQRLQLPGADLQVTLRHRRTVVAFRRWKAASIGVEPLRELQAAQNKLEAEAALYVATGTLSEKAGDFVRDIEAAADGRARTGAADARRAEEALSAYSIAAMSDTIKVALVTGAARGIGLASAQWFLEQGHAVALLDIDAATLHAAAARLAPAERVLVLHADVRDPAQVAAAVAAVDARFGRLDALVNNAGIAVFKPLLDTAFDEWRDVMATNLDGPFLCTQAAAPLMLKHGGGAVVNIASISGLRASTLRVAYGTSKAALDPPDQAAGGGAGRHRHPRQLHRAGAGGHRDGQAGAQRRHPPPTTTTAFRWAATARRKRSPPASASCAATLPATSTARCLAVDGGFDATGIGLPSLRRDRGRA